jgi:hypothetical protein
MPNDNQLERFAEDAERRACRHCDHHGWRTLHTEDGYERVGKCLHAAPEIQDVGYETVKRNPNDPVQLGQIAGYEKIGARFPVQPRLTTQTTTTTENTP